MMRNQFVNCQLGFDVTVTSHRGRLNVLELMTVTCLVGCVFLSTISLLARHWKMMLFDEERLGLGNLRQSTPLLFTRSCWSMFVDMAASNDV